MPIRNLSDNPNPALRPENLFLEKESSPISFASIFPDVFKAQTACTIANLRPILTLTAISHRCFELTNYLRTCCPEDLGPSFQHIVDNVFGRNGFIGWDMKMITRQGNPRDSEAILKFLGPNGPLIATAYKLLEYPLLRYEFQIKDLPKRIEKQITSGSASAFFTSKAHIVTDKFLHGYQSNVLRMNPFEYYFFQFAMMNLGASDSCNYLVGWGVSTESLYSLLIEEYLAYFFPCDGSGVQGVDQCAAFLSQHNICQPPNIVPSRPNFTVNLDRTENVQELPHLFKESIFKDQLNAPRETPFTGATSTSIYKEVWRSEIVLSTFIELYLSYGSDHSDSFTEITDMDSGLPTVDLVKGIRLIVRHLHYFLNCINKTAFHPMDEIKRKLIPIYQKKLYFFIRFLFNRWPLDSSFRIVYETWLSYIQPWRYTNYSKFHGYKSKELDEVPIDDRFQSFLMENILFYTVLFNSILERFLRSDLSNTKGSLMIFRVMKVFANNDSLKYKLSEIERSLKNELTASPATSLFIQHFVTNVGSPPGSFHEGYPSSNKFGNVKQLLKELEPQETYQPLFSEETRETVKNVMKYILSVKKTVSTKLTSEEIIQMEIAHSWVSIFLKWIFFETQTVDPSKKTDNSKIVNHLDVAFAHFSTFFVIESSEVEDPNVIRPEYSDSEVLSSENTDKSALISPKIVLPGALNPTGGIMENPDVALIRSDESKIVVRLAYNISNYINERVGPRLEKVYFENSFKGKVARSILAKPCFYDVLDKSSSGHQIRKKLYLPPRVSLRFLGSSGALLTLLLIGLIFFFLEVGSVWAMLFYLLLLFVSYVGLRAALEPPRVLQLLRMCFFGKPLPRIKRNSTPKSSTPKHGMSLRPKNRFTL